MTSRTGARLWRFSSIGIHIYRSRSLNSLYSRISVSRLPWGSCRFWSVGRNFNARHAPETTKLRRPKVRCVRMMASTAETRRIITPYSQQARPDDGATESGVLGSGCQCACTCRVESPAPDLNTSTTSSLHSPCARRAPQEQAMADAGNRQAA